jgi:thymidylate synthase (FAD)
MKIVKPSHSILLPENPLKHIEKIGRICYKSEDAITDISAKPFVGRLFKSGHHAMIEHFRFIAEIDQYDYQHLAVHVSNNKYITLTDDGRYVMSASARGINDMFVALYNDDGEDRDSIIDVLDRIVEEIVHHYNCAVMFDNRLTMFPGYEYTGVRIIDNFDELSPKEYRMHAWYSVLFTCDRGVTHEMVRHRDASFAQESTRYCNYSNGKYGGEITVIEPCFWDTDSEQYQLWWKTCKYMEEMYMQLINSGATPQQARSVLPSSTKAEIVITAQVYEWNHIFDLRVLGVTGAPHPQIKEVMEPAYEEMWNKGYLV